MKHISILLPDLETGGAQRIMLLLSREFSRRGLQVEIVVLKTGGPLYNTIPEGVNLTLLHANGQGLRFALSSALRLAGWMRQTRTDALLSSLRGTNLLAILTRSLLKAHLRLVIREAASVSKTATGLRLQAMRWLYPCADCTIAINPVMKEELTTCLGIPAAQTVFIPNPVDINWLRKKARAAITLPWPKDKEKKIVLSVGRLIPEKDFPTLLRAFALQPASLKARLIIVGEGPEQKNIELLIKELGLDESVHLAGFDDNPWRWMASAQLFVLSSQAEGFPNALMEALVLGLPAIVTRYDDSAEYFRQHYGADLCGCGDEIMLAEKIRQHLESPHRRAYLTDNTNHIVDEYLKTLKPVDLQ